LHFPASLSKIITVSDAKSFLILNAVIVTLLVAYFLTLYRKERPTRLNFKKGPSGAPGKGLQVSDPRNFDRTIPLNVIFNFNGHSFDAFEVLGIPAGSTIEEAQAALARIITTSDGSSKEFYRMAFEAIERASRGYS